MKAIFVETRSFTKLLNRYFAGDWDYQEFQMALLEMPEKGDVIQGCISMFRKSLASRFLLLDVYNKDEADDLTQDERRFLAGLAEEYRTAAIAAGTRRKRGKR